MSAMGVERAQVVYAFADLAALKLATMCDGALLVCHTNEPTQHLRPLLGWWGKPESVSGRWSCFHQARRRLETKWGIQNAQKQKLRTVARLKPAHTWRRLPVAHIVSFARLSPLQGRIFALFVMRRYSAPKLPTIPPCPSTLCTTASCPSAFRSIPFCPSAIPSIASQQ